MGRFITKRLFYGFLVMWGVISVVFFLFNILPGDPARVMVGQSATKEQIDAIHRDIGSDKPVLVQYLLYLNDISPLSIHETKNTESSFFLNEKKYTSVIKLFPVSSSKVFVLKTPYLRRSYISRRPVSDILADTLPETAVLAFAAMLIASVIGILLGILAAVRKGTWLDTGSLFFAVLGMSGPSFYVGLIMAMTFGYLWSKEFPFPAVILVLFFGGGIIGSGIGIYKKKKKQLQGKLRDYIIHKFLLYGFIGFVLWMAGYLINLAYHVIPFIDSYIIFPGTGLNNEGSLYIIDDFGEEHLSIKNIILPAITLGIRPLAIIVQLTRSSLLDVLSQDYIRTATAKGLSYYTIIFKHALKNSLNPVVTAISGWFAGLMAGAVFVEYVFGWRGIGSEIVNALDKQDLPIIMGGVLVIGFIYVIINITVDVVYGILDPRIRLQ
ncbi:MAG: ABC transporter permease [Bacteroidetes bacterium]|nr:ABC transporter permease [Bacteroidota bacterium]